MIVPLLLSLSVDVHRLSKVKEGLNVERFGLLTCEDEIDEASDIENEEWNVVIVIMSCSLLDC